MDDTGGGEGGSGNASGGDGASGCRCYYEVLGVRKNASAADVRAAYRRLALKWHPDRCASDPGEAKQRFQRIQEAYSVLSDKGKRAMYDAGLFDPLDDDDQVQGFSDFMQELLVMMDNVKNEKQDTLEDLQKMLDDIISDDGRGGGGSSRGGGIGGRVPSDGTRRTRVSPYPPPPRR